MSRSPRTSSPVEPRISCLDSHPVKRMLWPITLKNWRPGSTGFTDTWSCHNSFFGFLSITLYTTLPSGCPNVLQPHWASVSLLPLMHDPLLILYSGYVYCTNTGLQRSSILTLFSSPPGRGPCSAHYWHLVSRFGNRLLSGHPYMSWFRLRW